MCTYVRNGADFRRNRNPIRCWKIVHKTGNGYYKPYYYSGECVYRDGETQTLPERCMNASFGYVEIGFHSYADKDEFLERYHKYFADDMLEVDAVVVECEIPEGALFIECEDIIGMAVYVSSEIKVIGEVICP